MTSYDRGQALFSKKFQSFRFFVLPPSPQNNNNIINNNNKNNNNNKIRQYKMQEKDKFSDYSIFYLKHENTSLIHLKIQEGGLDIIAYSMVRA